MSANFNAELYASKNNSANAKLNAEIYASRNIPAHATLNGEIYATADPLLYRVNAEFDTKRIINNSHPITQVFFDTKRTLSGLVEIEVDTKRKLSSDLIRAEINADTKRIKINEVTAKADTRRVVENDLIHALVFGDTMRSKKAAVEFEFDAQRKITHIINIEGDTKRKKTVTYSVTAEFDSKRSVCNGVNFEFDTSRFLAIGVNLEFDTRRATTKLIEFETDTKRRMLLNLGNLSNGVQSINLTLQTGTLSDGFTLTGINKIYPKEVIEGVLLDFPFHFQAEETKEEGILFSVTKTSYNSDLMNYMLLNNDWKNAHKESYRAYNSETKGWTYQQLISVRTYCEKIVGGIGLNLHWQAGDFAPEELTEWATYQSYLSSLFGWTSNIPRKKYIVFIRDKKELYVLQRGRESGNINLDEYKWFNYPSYTRRQIRTAWMKPTDEAVATEHKLNKVLVDVTPGKFDEVGDSSSSSYDAAEIEQVSRHNASPQSDNRLRYTKKLNPDGSVTETNYSYEDTGRNYVLRKITETTKKEPSTDPITGITVPGYKTTRVTVYSYLSGGIKHTDVYVNNIKVEESEEVGGSSEETNDTATTSERVRPGDEGNEFLDDQADLAHGGSWKTNGSSTKSSFLNNSEAPILDYGNVKAYYEELEWMDRAIEEIATLTITAPVKNGVIAKEDNHVFDFFDTYTLNGNTYYLESNSVSMTPRSIKQQLTLIRWYK